MIHWLIKRRIKAVERNFNYDTSYMRDILDASSRAFWRFSRIFGMARYCEDVPREAWYAAKITTALLEDCGPCTQLVITMAERDGVKAPTIRNMLSGDEQALPPEASLGARFARAVLCRNIAEADALRAEVLATWGPRGLVSLAFAIASARIFPTIKYALGRGRVCTAIRVAGVSHSLLHQETEA